MPESIEPIQELFAAIETSDVEQVKRLLALDIDLDRKNANGQTALALASRIGNSEIIQLLISAGAKVNLEPEPLAFNPRISVSELPGSNNLGELIAQATAEAPEEVKNFYAGFMGVMDALSGQSSRSSDDERDGELTQEKPLIEVDDSEEDEYEEDEEEYEDEEVARTPLGAAVLQGDISILRTLLEAGANPNPSVWHETPALVVAVRKGRVEIVQTLIAAGANVNRGFDELPLHTAAKKGHLEVVRFESRGDIIPRPSRLDLGVQVSPHPAPDVLRLAPLLM